MKHEPLRFLFAGSLVGAVSLAACSEVILVEDTNNASAQLHHCQTIIVDDPDGFVNVRSSPQVRQDNLVRSLLNGTEINTIQQQSGWLHIDSPIEGWVDSNRTAFCCASYIHTFEVHKVLVIGELGQQATTGDLEAAESLIKLWTDGAYAEAQAAALAAWAGENPQFLISVLAPQPQALRQEILLLLNYGLGEDGSQARQNFEVALEQLPGDHPIVQAWQNRLPYSP
ncbi:SH3 domain-containing protein [Leptolyngbya sp. PCC 7375]|nr:SH3 domain-containing protein [Leptolyngbya sp. PCC 7375]